MLHLPQSAVDVGEGQRGKEAEPIGRPGHEARLRFVHRLRE